ncbi:MAG: GGDEF domain-containing protein [Brevinematales bacterium]|nr:GGDEF domain-containing protein [Brevinematales bacterium]
MEKNKNIELKDFQLRNIEIITHLFKAGVLDDDIVENLRLAELEYFSLLDKYDLLEKKVNVDEKTNLLKFKKDYLNNIVKTASRIFYDGFRQMLYHISFVRFDIDNFSSFNNHYGHDVGDKILIEIAEILKNGSRPTDYVIRFGGEEFDVILPATDIEGAKVYVEKIINKIRSLELDYNGQKLKVTVSAGISSISYRFVEQRFLEDAKIESDYQKLQQEADNALYEAKYLGKDRFCVYDPSKKEEYSKIRKLYVK